jgi:hypothetical protein
MESGKDSGNFHEMEDVEISTIYHKLGSLSTEIEQQILELNGNSDEIKRSVQWMRNESYKETSPDIDFATRLFRRYVDEAQAARLRAAASSGLESGDSSHHGGEGRGEGTVSLIGEAIPHYLYEGSAEQIVGYGAFKSNVFWSRVVTGLLSFIAFVIMSCVPLIAHKRVSPHMLFNVRAPRLPLCLSLSLSISLSLCLSLFVSSLCSPLCLSCPLSG